MAQPSRRGTITQPSPQHTRRVSAYPEIAQTSVLGDDPPTDLDERFELVFAEMARQLTENEAPLRAMLRFLLENPQQRDHLLLRRGRRITWLTDALSPRTPTITTTELEKLVLGIASCTGIKSYIWLKDIAGCSHQQALDIMHHTATTLLTNTRRP